MISFTQLYIVSFTCLFNLQLVVTDKSIDDEILLHSGNIPALDMFHSSVKITDDTFSGFKDHDTGRYIYGINTYQLMYLTRITRILGNLTVTANLPKFVNLNFLRNVESIDSLTITNTSLQYLGLISLKNIKNVVIENNKYLCVNGTKSFWQSMMNGTQGILKISNNKAEEDCGSCDVECDHHFGCHGPGPGFCKKCRHFFDARSKQCVESCGGNQYVYQEVCNECHQNCHHGGCSGPFNFEGFGGCNSCPKPLIRYWKKISFDHQNTFFIQMLDCLELNNSCPTGTFEDLPSPTAFRGMLKTLSGKPVCAGCHPYCSKCTGYGFDKNVCQECKWYTDCACPAGSYFDTHRDRCVACDDGCKTCSDHGNCLECDDHHVYRVYDKGVPSVDGRYRCVHKCSEYHPFPMYDKLYQNYCSSVNANELKATPDKSRSGDVYLLMMIVVGSIFLVGFISYWHLNRLPNAHRGQKELNKVIL